ncbi:Hypothetical predicted protein [Pelobates cultripes]|uniref:GPALPP motifs-containing protein 1 n=1 Tax=Pelobates cultripes TaxID=61616 RepID=A0AAD1R4Y1_PELCU|nr:Hypothetical predicted protein [Pelobates cultripes]
MSREVIGPALPPGFQNREEQEKPEEVAGPILPPGYTKTSSSDSSDDSEQDTGPNPWHHKRDQSTHVGKEDRKQTQSSAEEEDDGFFGPALPPGFKKTSDSPERPIIGPALPPGFSRNLDDDSTDDSGSSNHSSCEEQVESSGDEHVIGPVPTGGPVTSSVAEDFERRAWKMKQKLTGNDDDGSKKISRESWMTELPPEMTSFGLGPRSFKRKTNEKSGDRTIWTDTPADRERKAKEHSQSVASTPFYKTTAPLNQNPWPDLHQAPGHHFIKLLSTPSPSSMPWPSLRQTPSHPLPFINPLPPLYQFLPPLHQSPAPLINSLPPFTQPSAPIHQPPDPLINPLPPL